LPPAEDVPDPTCADLAENIVGMSLSDRPILEPWKWNDLEAGASDGTRPLRQWIYSSATKADVSRAFPNRKLRTRQVLNAGNGALIRESYELHPEDVALQRALSQFDL